MIREEYKELYERLLLHSRRFVQDSCKVTGSFQRVESGEADPRFLNDYRNYAFTKATKSLIGLYSLLEMGNYEDALILSRTIFECYLSERYFDDKFDIDTIMDMVVIPTAIGEGDLIHKNGIVVRSDTKDTVEYNIISPENLSIGKDKGYFYDLYYFLCQNAHCNISQVKVFLDEHNDCVLYKEDNSAAAHFIGLFVFSKLFESVVLLESTRFENPEEEKECRELLVDLTTFLYDRMAVYVGRLDSGVNPSDKETRKTVRSMMNSLKEQLGRVDKDFVLLIEKQYVETTLEKALKPALLESEKPSAFFEDLRERGKLNPRYTEIEKLIGIPQNPEYHPEGDVWTHTMMVLDRAAAYRSRVQNPYGFMLLALTHDLGKIVTTTEENGKIRSIGHETEGLPLAEKLLSRITNNDLVKKYVMEMIPLHMKPILYTHDRSSEKATDRLFEEAPDPFGLCCFAMSDKEFTDEERDFLIARYEGYKRRKETAAETAAES